MLPQPLDRVEVVGHVAALLRRTLGHRIRLEVDAAGAAWPVRADDAQLENCLINLALNARDAMPGGGTLWLRVRDVGAAAAGGPPNLPAGEYVRFVVGDDGAGITPDLLDRVFEPFFTTKPIGRGTGLGLSMVQGFARQSGGDVLIESVAGTAAGHGTTVSLWLPRLLPWIAPSSLPTSLPATLPALRPAARRTAAVAA